jgi:hypothetical protein
VSGLALCIKYREEMQQYGSIMVLIGGAKFLGEIKGGEAIKQLRLGIVVLERPSPA